VIAVTHRFLPAPAHGGKTKAAEPSRFSIVDQFDLLDHSKLFEVFLYLVFRHFKVQIAYE
jgi:hypothetical protein